MPVPATITVFGTAAIDINFGKGNFPEPGKELAVKVFLRPGGKGVFQAIACRRLAARTTFISAVGNDTFGELILERLGQEGVDTRVVELRTPFPQGGMHLSTDIVAVFPGEDDTAEGSSDEHNRRTAYIAARHPLMMSSGYLDDTKTVQMIQESDATLLSLDAPLDKVQKVLELARRYSKAIVINASPPVALPLSVLRGQGKAADRGDVDFVIATSREARDWLELLGMDVSAMPDDDVVAATIQDAGARNVVIASEGGRCIVVSKNTVRRYEIIEEKRRRGTNGARSAFCAALAVRYAELQPSPEGLAEALDDIVGFAAAARVYVSVGVVRVDALPRREDVDEIVRFEPKAKLIGVEPRSRPRTPPL